MSALTPDDPNRMRRDFLRMLGIMQTSALLHQYQRGNGDEVEVLPQDFIIAERLFRVAFGHTLTSVPEGSLRVYTAMKELYATSSEGIGKAVLAARLKVSGKTISRWIDFLVDTGIVESSGRVGAGRGNRTVYTLVSELKLPKFPTLRDVYPDAHGVLVDPFTGEEINVGDVPL